MFWGSMLSLRVIFPSLTRSDDGRRVDGVAAAWRLVTTPSSRAFERRDGFPTRSESAQTWTKRPRSMDVRWPTRKGRRERAGP